jgi:SSS family solute:Na+ symporter
MLEICSSIADGKPSCEIHPLGIGGKADPVRLVFGSAPGRALNASVVDMGNRFRLLVNEVIAVAPMHTMPNLPVARVLWKPYPNMHTGCAAWILAGGAHHTCYSQNLTTEYMADFAEMANDRICADTVVVNLTSILYLGALAIHAISGLPLYLCMIFLAGFAIIITLGGMKVIGYTDVIQVFFLIVGGLATTYLALSLVSDKFGGNGVFDGLKLLTTKAGDHFHMILKPDNPNYISLPGLTVLIGGMWIVNLNYWGCNQYITQRALGADLKTARSGILFAAFLKLLMPVIVVLPGIAAYVLYQNGGFHEEMMPNGEIIQDNAYPTMLNLLGPGLKGLAFAALTAAVVASLAGKANSIATIFTLDIYKKKINPEASEKNMVWVGKVAVIVALILGVVIAPFMGIDKKGGFEFIQEYTGFVSPGIFAMFILGFFWKKTTSNAALFATVGGFIFSVFFKFLPKLMDLSFLEQFGFAAKNGDGVYEIPFLDRMGFVFVMCIVGMWIISMIDNKRGVKPNGLEVDRSMFKLSPGFTVGVLFVCGILAALYTFFW